MKNLLVLGCSYSALYYHPDPRWSYTWLLKEALGVENLINLSYGGNSPAGATRHLEWYLNNPIKGLPDVIFVQVPQGSREEYYLSDTRWKYINEVTFLHTNDVLFKGKAFNNTETGMPNVRDDRAWQDYEKYIVPEDKKFDSNSELVKDVPWDNIVCIAGTLWNQKETYNSLWLDNYLKKEYSETFFLTSDSVLNVNASWNENRTVDNPTFKRIIKNFHMLWLSHKKPRSAMLNTTRKEMAIMQMLADKHDIPIFFNSSDNIIVPESGEYETWCDESTHYDSMINWNHYLKYHSISNHSKTWANDNYWDGHPGRQSHKNFADVLISFINNSGALK